MQSPDGGARRLSGPCDSHPATPTTVIQNSPQCVAAGYSSERNRAIEIPQQAENKYSSQCVPTVVIVLIDDIGFGAATTFGGAIHTPTLERLASNGVRFDQFRTTALCSPTRMAIRTGRNHHSANAGSVMQVATAFQGNRGQRPQRVAPVNEMLRLNGYSTAD